MGMLNNQIAMLDHAALMELRGAVHEVRGLGLHVSDLPVPVGAMVSIHPRRGRGQVVEGQVVGFDRHRTVVMPLADTAGITRGDVVIAREYSATVRVGHSLLGRVLDGLGRPMDGLGPLRDTVVRSLNPSPVDPMDRPLIDKPLATGVRAIDAMLSVGLGQRLGIFASPGLGKSTLLGTMARHTSADVVVIGLVGERGREVRDFLENQLGPDGRSRSVVVTATGDDSALLRIRAALVATTVAEYFRDAGLDVLLIMDSVTRFCQAQRQVGLASGEPPATKGYTPSVFSTLPVLLERTGRTSRGSITGFYSVLVEGEELTDPIADAARGILDGHIVLSHDLANRGHWPAIDVLASISRVADEVTDKDHQAARRQVLRLVHAYQQVEDLLNIGAYAAGSNPDFDLAIACKQPIDQLLQQGRSRGADKADFARTRALLMAVQQQVERVRATTARQGGMQGRASAPVGR